MRRLRKSMTNQKRLLVHVEGHTEKRFVQTVLGPYLRDVGYDRVSARLVGNARASVQRGGTPSWQTVRDGIVNHIKDDRQAILSTMVDRYGMPQAGQRAWPGRSEASTHGQAQRAAFVQKALADDIANHMPPSFDRHRFIPYVSMYEFEALLFSDCARFAESIGHPDIAGPMEEILTQFGDPEAIDDSQETAPSKRILRLLPSYRKVAMGAAAIQSIGLADIRNRCANFADWLKRLEAAGS